MRRKKKAMKPYAEMTKEELQELRKQLSTKYRERIYASICPEESQVWISWTYPWE